MATLDTTTKYRKKDHLNGSKRKSDAESLTEAVSNGLDHELKTLIGSLGLSRHASGDDPVQESRRKQKATKGAKKKAPTAASTSKIKPEPDPARAPENLSSAFPPSAPTTKSWGRVRPSKLLVAPGPRWYDAVPALSPDAVVEELSLHQVQQKIKEANTLLQKEAATAEANPSKAIGMGGSDQAFLSQVLSGGTAADRLSALTLLAQASPLHNQRALESLKSMAAKRSREESLKALRALVDLWVGGAAPDRKLKYFIDQPLGHSDATDQHLIVWAFEDWFKRWFFSILQILERLTLDTLPYSKSQSLAMAYTLLKDRPEQEQNLLSLLVNKVGDFDRGVASTASHYLIQLLQVHPSMKAVVIREVSARVLRATTTSKSSEKASAAQHARYYGALTLIQIPLTAVDEEVARLLVALYFEMFVSILEESGQIKQEKRSESNISSATPERPKKGRGSPARRNGGDGQKHATEDTHSKLTAAILTGVNRAIPFAHLESTQLDKHVDTLFRVINTGTFSVSVQALSLVYHISSSNPSIIDRFYRSLYDSLLDPRLIDSSKQALYLNLLLKALTTDHRSDRIYAFIKRLMQSLSMHQPNFICGALFVIGQAMKSKPDQLRLAHQIRNTEDSIAEISGSSYDSKEREPLAAKAAQQPLWDVLPLIQHFHPTVAFYSRQLLSRGVAPPNSDLSLYSITSFLDRFISRTPKRAAAKGSSLMQPSSAQDINSRIKKGRSGVEEEISTTKLAGMSIDQVPVDQIFYKKYLSSKTEINKSKAKNVRSKAKESAAELGDAEALDSDEESEVWNAMQDGAPFVDEGAFDGNEEVAASAFSDELDELSAPDSEDGEDDDLPDMTGFEYDDDSHESEAGEDGEEWGGVLGEKRKKTESKAKPKKKPRLELPTFASYEDYAKMIDEADPPHDM